MSACILLAGQRQDACFLLYPELYMAFWRKQIRVWVESSGSQTRVLFAKSTLFPKLIRTWFEQDSKESGEKESKWVFFLEIIREGNV